MVNGICVRTTTILRHPVKRGGEISVRLFLKLPAILLFEVFDQTKVAKSNVPHKKIGACAVQLFEALLPSVSILEGAREFGVCLPCRRRLVRTESTLLGCVLAHQEATSGSLPVAAASALHRLP